MGRRVEKYCVIGFSLCQNWYLINEIKDVETMHDIYHVILKNRKIDRLIMPFEALYCVWLIITLILNFKLFAYSIDAQFVLITLFYFSGWISSLVKKHKMKQ